MMFQKGGNAVDAAAAMLAAVTTMWTCCRGEETQALIYHPDLKKVIIGINAPRRGTHWGHSGVLPSRGMNYLPEFGLLAS
ncbi:MAG: hypothetical protein R2882_04135 [Gemmatimonadales bacterium]